MSSFWINYLLISPCQANSEPLANFSLGDRAVEILERDLKTLNNAFSTCRRVVVTQELHKGATLEKAGKRFIRKSVVPRTVSASS